MTIKVTDLCKDLDDEFRDLMGYTRNLGFADHPDYAKYRDAFSCILKKHGFM
jgi:hypothetical protein